MDYWAKDIYSWGIFSAEVYPRSSIAIQRTVRMSWISCPSTDGSTSSEPMGLCITSIVKTLTDSHTLDDRIHQGHHTALLLSETLLSTAQASLCVGEVRNLESTGSPCGEFWSQISTCILAGYRLNKAYTWRHEEASDHVPVVLRQDWRCARLSWQCLVFSRSVTRSGRRIHRTWKPQVFMWG